MGGGSERQYSYYGGWQWEAVQLLSLLSHLCTVFTVMFLTQTVFIGYMVLELLCISVCATCNITGRGGSERQYSYYPCYHIITIIIIIIIIIVTMGITQFTALNIPRQCPLHLHQHWIQLDLHLKVPHLLTIPWRSNTNNKLQWLPVRTFYSARHQTTHHLELKKNNTAVLT